MGTGETSQHRPALLPERPVRSFARHPDARDLLAEPAPQRIVPRGEAEARAVVDLAGFHALHQVARGADEAFTEVLRVAALDENLFAAFDVSLLIQAEACFSQAGSYYLTFIREHEGQFRQFLAQTMRSWADNAAVELRGARRTRAFSTALEPVRASMKASEFEDLVRRLSMLTGLEQHIALTDVLGVDEATGDRLQSRIIDAVLDRYLPARHKDG